LRQGAALVEIEHLDDDEDVDGKKPKSKHSVC
jgi:hypothetical protein